MRVETLHSHASAADTAGRPRANAVGRDQRVSFRRVGRVHLRQSIETDLRLRSINTACLFKPADPPVELWVDKPEPRRHRCSVIEKGRVLDHRRPTVAVAGSHGERGPRPSAEAALDVLGIRGCVETVGSRHRRRRYHRPVAPRAGRRNRGRAVDLGITGRRAIVAAGTAGLGLATAQALADEGALVAVCGRNPDRLDAAVAALGPDAVGIVADLADPFGAVQFAEDAEDLLGGTIDICVANAGGPPPGFPSTTSLDEYRHALELNSLATIALVHAVLPAMRAQRWGRILAITSIGARQPIPGLAASSAARAATTSFIKTLSVEVGPDGVTANTIQPGLHATDRVKALHGGADQTADIPLDRIGDPDDFGAVAAFLCSEPANYITGASLIVDGGASRGLQ